ncbi:MAG: hypothetical protein QNL11_06000 [Desulfobacterales bacterium]|nr:hypothetical protein [Desulfobacterales bacterium]
MQIKLRKSEQGEGVKITLREYENYNIFCARKIFGSYLNRVIHHNKDRKR